MIGLLLPSRTLENQSIIGVKPQRDVLPPWKEVGWVELAAQAKSNVAVFSRVYNFHLKGTVWTKGAHW